MLPAWVVEAESLRICWANDRALEFWAAADRAELFARDVVGSAPPTVLARMQGIVAKVRAS